MSNKVLYGKRAFNFLLISDMIIKLKCCISNAFKNEWICEMF